MWDTQVYYACCRCRVCKRTEYSFRDASIAFELYKVLGLLSNNSIVLLKAASCYPFFHLGEFQSIQLLGKRVSVHGSVCVRPSKHKANVLLRQVATNLVPSRGDRNTLVISGQHILHSGWGRTQRQRRRYSSLWWFVCWRQWCVGLMDGRHADGRTADGGNSSWSWSTRKRTGAQSTLAPARASRTSNAVVQTSWTNESPTTRASEPRAHFGLSLCKVFQVYSWCSFICSSLHCTLYFSRIPLLGTSGKPRLANWVESHIPTNRF